MNKYNKSIKIGIAVIVIIIFYILYNIDWSDEYLISERIIFNYADTSKDVVNNLLVSIITGLITILAVILTIEHTNVINDENKKIEKEIAYRSINKQNSNVILSEIRKFYANACYFSALNQIAGTLGIVDLFNYELEKIKENNIIFLRRLKEDFSYDNEILNQINCINVNSDNLEYFMSCKELFEMFYGFSDSTNKKLNIQHAEEKAKKKLYEILYRSVRHKHLKERVILWINNEGKYLELKEKDEVNQIQILESISKLKPIFNNPNLTCDEFKKRIETPIYKNIISSLKEIYSDVPEDSVIEYLYILCKDCYKSVNGKRLYDNLGTNSDEFEQLFIEKFKIDYFENIPQDNRIYQNVEKYHYL